MRFLACDLRRRKRTTCTSRRRDFPSGECAIVATTARLQLRTILHAFSTSGPRREKRALTSVGHLYIEKNIALKTKKPSLSHIPKIPQLCLYIYIPSSSAQTPQKRVRNFTLSGLRCPPMFRRRPRTTNHFRLQTRASLPCPLLFCFSSACA